MDQGNIAFVLICAALALIMTPGLAFLYGGVVRAQSAISMMMLSFGAMGLVGVLWILYGYAVVYSGAGSPTYFGIDGVFGIEFAHLGFAGLFGDDPADALKLAEAAFQGMFAIITVALVSGAIADRARFGAWMVFAGVWSTLVYFPVASWIFNMTWGAEGIVDGGWIVYGLQSVVGAGVLDFAGGTAVHINAGAAALALALVLGKRIGFAKGIQKPHSIPFVLLGASLLWFGWFGFNAGSEGAADGFAALAVMNTIVAPAASLLTWLIVETIRGGKATAVGAALGAVSGLVAITPGCAYLTPVWAVVLGLLSGVVCALAVDLKFVLGFDDSLDVVGVHLVGGLIGTLYLGVFALGDGLLYSGRANQLAAQSIAAFAVMIYSFLVTYAIGFVIERTMGFRVRESDDVAGLDAVQHGESALTIEGRRPGGSRLA
ncbi:ammonium transporter [Amnibacterium flavum]|uniref:Ammonium transporter n=1 Tax=Amnibacterium flavum TaxID=2173173 RepID=A0A2V1HVE5_9MICO|nr:ammonium transporter [Amnibacterium flavum]PVZ94317.1 ammonia channel protein [Amnibacterium flavum]